MKIAKCVNNHYYDSDKFESCPYCTEIKKGNYPTEIEFDKTEDLTEMLTQENQKRIEREDEVTVAYYRDIVETDPVVGWLVCVKGIHLGKSFHLKSGRNFVGRDKSMDVVLDGDKTISRQKHAIIVYDPKSKRFIAQPGESKELFYVNDEVVLSNVLLNPYDSLEIGKSKLLFVPFCSEKFCWEDITEG